MGGHIVLHRRVDDVRLTQPLIPKDVGFEPAPIDAVEGVCGVGVEERHPGNGHSLEHDLAVHAGHVFAQVVVLGFERLFERLVNRVVGVPAHDVARVRRRDAVDRRLELDLRAHLADGTNEVVFRDGRVGAGPIVPVGVRRRRQARDSRVAAQEAAGEALGGVLGNPVRNTQRRLAVRRGRRLPEVTLHALGQRDHRHDPLLFDVVHDPGRLPVHRHELPDDGVGRLRMPPDRAGLLHAVLDVGVVGLSQAHVAEGVGLSHQDVELDAGPAFENHAVLAKQVLHRDMLLQVRANVGEFRLTQVVQCVLDEVEDIFGLNRRHG